MVTSDHGEERVSANTETRTEIATGQAGEGAGETEQVDTGQDQEVGRAEGAGSAESAVAEEIAEQLHELVFNVAKSLRYHAKRAGWFEGWHNWAMGASVISATAAFATVSGVFPEVAKWVAVGFACLTVSDLVIGFHRRARAYVALYQRFSALAIAIAGEPAPTDQKLRKWMVEKLRIQADEPPILGTLNVLCHNEEAEARGYGSEHRYRLPLVERSLAQWCTLRGSYDDLRGSGKQA